MNKLLVVDTGSLTGADKVVTALVEALSEVPGSRPGHQLKPVQTNTSARFPCRIGCQRREAPFNFTVDRDCELKTPDDQKSTVRYSRHTLEIDEVAQHIAAGKVPTQLAMTWNDRVSFMLTETAQVQKIKLLDVVLDGVQEGGKDDDGFDTDAAIITGELSGLIPDLLDALGGEMVEARRPRLEGKPGCHADDRQRCTRQMDCGSSPQCHYRLSCRTRSGIDLRAPTRLYAEKRGNTRQANADINQSLTSSASATSEMQD